MSESARINKLLESIRCKELDKVIQRGGGACCNHIVESASIVSRSGVIEEARGDTNLWGIVFPGSEVINGSKVQLESSYTKKLNDAVISSSVSSEDPNARFSIYRRPYIPPVCPPIPAYILNGNLPKGSTRVPCPIQRFEGTIVRKCSTIT